jgi:hypothetical protein
MKTKSIFLVFAFCLLLQQALGQQHRIPLYAHGNSGSDLTGSFKTVFAIAGQNVIGVSQGTNFKAYFGLMAPISLNLTGINQVPVNSVSLGQNYPNPFRYNTSIPFSIDIDARVKISILDITGRELMVLRDKNYPPGNYIEIFDAITLEAGLYFYRLYVNNYHKTKTMVLLE